LSRREGAVAKVANPNPYTQVIRWARPFAGKVRYVIRRKRNNQADLLSWALIYHQRWGEGELVYIYVSVVVELMPLPMMLKAKTMYI
jgi:hypothetical protein